MEAAPLAVANADPTDSRMTQTFTPSGLLGFEAAPMRCKSIELRTLQSRSIRLRLPRQKQLPEYLAARAEPPAPAATSALEAGSYNA